MSWSRSRLFWKITGTYSLVSAVALGALVLTLNSILETNTRRTLEADARQSLAVVRASFSGHSVEEVYQQWQPVFRLRNQFVTICDAEGQTLLSESNEFFSEPLPSELQRMLIRNTALEEWPVIWRRDKPNWVIGATAIRSDSDLTGYLIIGSDVAQRLERAKTNREWAVNGAITAWACGTACLALVAILYVRPFRMLMHAVRTKDDSLERRDLLIRLSERNDEFGDVARFLENIDRERRGQLTDVREKEQAMRASTTQLSAMLQAMVEGVIAVDMQERVLFANNVACSMMSLDPRTVGGRPAFEVLRNTHVQDAVREALSKRELASVEFKQPRTNSSISLVVSPISDRGGAVLVFDDVTEVRRLESMRRDFVSGVGHELKTPLTVIQACTETLLDGAIDDAATAQRFLKQIEEQSERLLELILGMLHLSRLESGQQVFENLPVDLREVAERVVAGVKTIADGKHIELSITGESELFVLGDYQAIRTIVGNLVDNALKYTPENGQVQIDLVAEEQASVLRVIDNGVGIAEKDHQRVFERFYRVEADRNRERGGTGLGLAIVKHLCQAMHAEVSLQSQKNKGSTVEVRFTFDEA